MIASTLLLSAAIGAGAIYVAKRMHARPYEEAAARVAKISEARFIAKKYADEGFPAWVVSNPDYPCPQRLAELDVYVGRRDTIDPWGLPFQSYCHSGNTFRVVSAGPDRTHGTHDDIVEGS